MRGGHRAMVLLTMAARAAVCLALVGQLRALVVFPLTFTMLVLAKTYSVTRNALIPRLVAGDALVSTNARLSLVSTIASGVGGARSPRCACPPAPTGATRPTSRSRGANCTRGRSSARSRACWR
jgi:hypothetical protein